jgi:hypothetical protein
LCVFVRQLCYQLAEPVTWLGGMLHSLRSANTRAGGTSDHTALLALQVLVGWQCCTTQRCWHCRFRSWHAVHSAAGTSCVLGYGNAAISAAGTASPGLSVLLHYTALLAPQALLAAMLHYTALLAPQVLASMLHHTALLAPLGWAAMLHYTALLAL